MTVVVGGAPAGSDSPARPGGRPTRSHRVSKLQFQTHRRRASHGHGDCHSGSKLELTVDSELQLEVEAKSDSAQLLAESLARPTQSRWGLRD